MLVNPTEPTEAPSDPTSNMELNTTPVANTPNTPNTTSGSDPVSDSTTTRPDIWIATGTAAFLIIVLVSITATAGCIVCKRRASRKRASTSDEVNQYNYIDSSQIHARRTMPTVPIAAQRVDEEYGREELEYVEMVPATDHDHALQTLSHTPPDEPEYISIKSQSLPATRTVSAVEEDGLITNAAYMSSIEMTRNVAYPTFRD